MICRPSNQPTVGQDLDAMVCWMTDKPLPPTRPLRAQAHDAVDARDRHRARCTASTSTPATRDERRTSSALNDLGRIQLRTTTPLVYDPYRHNRATGSFILVDEATNATVAAGMLLGAD